MIITILISHFKIIYLRSNLLTLIIFYYANIASLRFLKLHINVIPEN